MSFDTRDFRRALGRFATGICVVTAGEAAGATAVTVNSFASVSLDPPLVLWSLDRGSDRMARFGSAGRFVISVLGAGTEALSTRYASKGGGTVLPEDTAPTASGIPAIAGALATFECTLERALDGGDHVIFLGRVERFAWRDGAPLLYFGGAYAALGELPA